MRVQGGALIALLLASISIIGLAHAATPSGMGYVGVHTAGQISFDETLSVALSPDETLLATGTEGYVVITKMSDRSVVEILSVKDHATALQFSPDGSYLAVGLKSDSLSGDALKFYSTNDWSESDKTFTNGKNPRDISFTNSGDKVLVQGQDKDVFELSFPELSLLGHLNGHHTDDIKCSDYGYDGLISVTGGMDGEIAFWDMSDYSKSSSLKIGNYGVIDCDINPSSSQVVVLTENGEISVYWLNGTLIEDSIIDFIDAKEARWSHDGEHIHVLESHLLPSLQRVRASDWVIDEFTHIGHQVRTFDISQDGQTLVTSTGTIHVGVYQSNYVEQGVGQLGADFDEDGIPDSIDIDDDGDGILDIYDVSCDSSDCTKDPDSRYLRNIELLISGNKLIVSDSVSFGRYDSNALRNLTSTLLSDDNKINVDELSWMSTAMCDNIRHRDVIDQWMSMIEIEGSQLSNGSLACDPIAGISSNDFGDLSLRATFTWVTTFDLSSQPVAPYNITMKGILLAPTGSSAVIAPQFPLSLDFVDSNSQNFRIDIWNRSDTARIVLMEELEAVKPGAVGLVASFITDNLWIPISIVVGILVCIGLIFKQNRDISSALFESDEEKTEDYDEEEDEYIEPVEDEYEEETSASWSNSSDSSPPKPRRGPPRKSTRRIAHEEYPIDETQEPVVKARRKRVGSKQPVGSKRKTLSESAELEYDYGEDGVYHDGDWDTEYDVYEPVQAKVRKVRKSEDAKEEVETKPSANKARRKVKRRNKNKDSSSKSKNKDAPVVAKKKVVSSRKKATNLTEDSTPQDDGGKESLEDEELLMDKALGMLTGDSED